MRYNLLILHNLGEDSGSLRSMVDYLRSFERYAPDHNYLYHRWPDPITKTLTEIDFHVVLLDASALGICRYRPREVYYQLKEAWSFVAQMPAIKLAFPQDDYHQSNELDALFDDWNMDVVYSVLPKHMNMFYPRSRKKSELKGVLTGYVDDNSIAATRRHSIPFGQRTLDIVQRVTLYSPVGGRYGRIKGLMAERFKEAAEAEALRIDISCRPESKLYGDSWLQLLGSSRFGLGCEGGMSLWDPDGIYHDRVRAFSEEHPEASFEEVEAACFAGQDMLHVFSAVSPRLFENAMMGASQALIEGEYLGLLTPWEHYIPVRQDLSDVEDAVAAMADLDGAEARAQRTYEALVENPTLRYSHLVAIVMADIHRLSVGRGFKPTSPSAFRVQQSRHQEQLRRRKRQSAAMAVAGKSLAALVPARMRRVVPASVKQLLRGRLWWH